MRIITAHEMATYVGLDIGGTKVMAATNAAPGAALVSLKRPTPSSLVDGLALLDQLIEEAAAGRHPDGIGVAIGGPLDWETGVVSPLHQPAWRNVPLRAHLERRWGCPVLLDVDTNIAALGEYSAGGYTAGRFLYLTLSTGMGGGFLIDGKLYRGRDGSHPEVGHQAIPFRCSHPERVRCDCGAPDCLEALVCGTGIRRVYGKPAELLGDDDWSEVAYNLGLGLRNIAAILGPDVIVLGGGVAHGRGERLLAPARRVMQEHLKLVPAPDVRLSCLGYDTALVGALIAAQSAADRAVASQSIAYAD